MFSELILLLMSTNFRYHLSSTTAQHLIKKTSSSSRCFCVILEASVYSTFSQHLTPYLVIHSLAVATFFLNYLKYFLSLPMQFQPETIWFLTRTKRKCKDQGRWGMNGVSIQKHAWVKYLFRWVLAHPRHHSPMLSTTATSHTHDFLTSVAGQQAPLPGRTKLWPTSKTIPLWSS